LAVVELLIIAVDRGVGTFGATAIEEDFAGILSGGTVKYFKDFSAIDLKTGALQVPP